MHVFWSSSVIWIWVGASPAAPDSAAALRKVADRYWESSLERNPTWATSIGEYRYNDRLEDVGEEGRKRWKSALKALQSDVERLPSTGLSPAETLTKEILARSIGDALLRVECLQHLTPLEPLDGPHIQFPLLLVSQPFRQAEDYRAYCARLKAFAAQITQHIANMRSGMTLGVVSPRAVIEKVVPQIRTHLVSDVTQSEFYKPVGKMSGLSEADRTALTADVREAISNYVLPAYLQLLGFVEDEYLAAARSEVGLCHVPNGEKIYELLAYLSTTVRLRPQELHELGLSEVARLRSEMAKVQQDLGYSGTLDEFLQHMRTDPKRRFTSAQELYDAAESILNRTKPLMPKLFGRLPKADCVMKEIEPFRAASSPVAYYNPSPEDGSRPGYYYINVHAPQERLRFTLEALSYHEAVPGHHLQGALDQENTELPKFQRYGSFTAYVEGWALYTEKLGYDIGGYADADSKFGQLTFEMWRACRLVVDTGMHAKRWTREQAIEYMAANTSLARIDIEAEIDRYIAWPGQALAYKVGELRISALRRAAEEKLGSRLDLRAFHDRLLSGGAMPIDMLERRMHEWIASQAR